MAKKSKKTEQLAGQIDVQEMKTKQKSKAPSQDQERAERALKHANEVSGVIFCLLAVLTGYCLMFQPQDPGLVGGQVRILCHGLLGPVSMVLPFFFLFWGVDQFLGQRFQKSAYRAMHLLLAVLLLAALWQSFTLSYERFNEVFIAYIRANFVRQDQSSEDLATLGLRFIWQMSTGDLTLGDSSLRFAGVLGASLSFGLSRLSGSIGTFAILIASLLIEFMIIFDISLSQWSEKGRNGLSKAFQGVKGALSREKASAFENATPDLIELDWSADTLKAAEASERKASEARPFREASSKAAPIPERQDRERMTHERRIPQAEHVEENLLGKKEKKAWLNQLVFWKKKTQAETTEVEGATTQKNMKDQNKNFPFYTYPEKNKLQRRERAAQASRLKRGDHLQAPQMPSFLNELEEESKIPSFLEQVKTQEPIGENFLHEMALRREEEQFQSLLMDDSETLQGRFPTRPEAPSFGGFYAKANNWDNTASPYGEHASDRSMNQRVDHWPEGRTHAREKAQPFGQTQTPSQPMAHERRVAAKSEQTLSQDEAQAYRVQRFETSGPMRVTSVKSYAPRAKQSADSFEDLMQRSEDMTQTEIDSAAEADLGMPMAQVEAEHKPFLSGDGVLDEREKIRYLENMALMKQGVNGETLENERASREAAQDDATRARAETDFRHAHQTHQMQQGWRAEEKATSFDEVSAPDASSETDAFVEANQDEAEGTEQEALPTWLKGLGQRSSAQDVSFAGALPSELGSKQIERTSSAPGSSASPSGTSASATSVGQNPQRHLGQAGAATNPFASVKSANPAHAGTLSATQLSPTQPSSPSEAVKPEQPYVFPPIELLEKGQMSNSVDRQEIREKAEELVNLLKDFGVETELSNITAGPTITRFELTPGQGVRVKQILNLSEDIKLGLAVTGLRIEAPIAGRSAVGIEIPNRKRQPVHLRPLIESESFAKNHSPLAVPLGRDIPGDPIICDLQKMPHMLIAGATGSGKSICINSILMSLIYRSTPQQVRLILIDPKMVELSIYNGIPHLLAPVVTEPSKAASTLKWVVDEMNRRYGLLAKEGAREIFRYNRMIKDELNARLAEREEMRARAKRYEPERSEAEREALIQQALPLPAKKTLPLILVVIDELADLMATAHQEVEAHINTLAAKARAAGIHLIVATQRPSVDVITGTIKSNVPSRLSFAVSSQIDSRTILDGGGAESLLGQGDLLYKPQGANKVTRGQGSYVSDEEVEAVVNFVRAHNVAEDDPSLAASLASNDGGQSLGNHDERDELYDEAVEIVLQAGSCSISSIQRRLTIGYPRAARLVDQMEQNRIVGVFEGSKPRKVLITQEDWERMKAERRGEGPDTYY